MIILKKIKARLLNDYWPLWKLPLKFHSFWQDRSYLEYLYKHKFKKNLDLANPKTFNEKTQWLKLYDQKPVYTQMADKYSVMDYVRKKIGEEYIIPILGVWNNFDEINFNDLPNQFVLKCTHDSGGVVICIDKEKHIFRNKAGFTLSMRGVKRYFAKLMKINYFYKLREWVYKNIKPRIIAQMYIGSSSGEPLNDYKIFTFNGRPKYIQAHFDKSSNQLKANFYSTDWVFQDFFIQEINDKNQKIEKPKLLDKMLESAGLLAEGTNFLRVDFFYINNKIYFGELTFYNWAGFGNFTPENYDEIFGSYITLPSEKTTESTIAGS